MGIKKVFGGTVPLIEVRKLVDDDNKMNIINSDGAIEVYIAKGADLIVDNTQTGSSLKKTDLVRT